MKQEVITRSAEETENLGEALAKQLVPGDVVALFGGMGAGKTVFVRGLARGLGCGDVVSSPTYALAHEYQNLVHFDMYRIEDWNDLESAGWFDYLNSGRVLAVEWSERIARALPEDAWRVEIAAIDENTRRIAIEKGARRDHSGD